MIIKNRLFIIVFLTILLFSSLVNAGITVYKKGDKYLKIGGRIQIQYHSKDDGVSDTDTIDFRRLRPYIEGSVHKNWKGKFQWDMAGASGNNEISIKDAYFQYRGFEGMKLTFGNALFPFSRETLTSSKKQALVERTFVGDHNYGAPGRNLGLHFTGKQGMLNWGFSLSSASIDPSADKIDFDTPVNTNSDFNEGIIVGGRIEFNVIGRVKLSQGNFSNKHALSFAVAAYQWQNDDDNIASANSLDTVNGLELSAAWRWQRFSIDAQINSFEADAVNATLTSGMYVNGSTKLEQYSVEAGYMLVPNKLEVVLGLSSQDADGYAQEWDRQSFGINYYIKKHDIKLQLTVRNNENVKGVVGNDLDEVFFQAQYVF